MGDKAKLFISQDDRDEAQVIADQLRELHDKGGYDWNKMAIFYRMNALSRVMEDALRNANMPYVMARGVEFYNRKEIKDTLAYLRVISNPADEVSLTRIVNVPPRGIGESSVKQMRTWAVGNGTNLWGAMERVGQIAGLSSRALKSVGTFVALVNAWRNLITPKPVAQAAGDAPGGLFLSKESSRGPVQTIMEDVVRRSGLETLYRKDKTGEETGEAGLDNINSLITSAAEYDAGNPEASVQEYLNMVSLVSDTDHMKGAGGAITMMTLHAAKGLEFPVVAIIGLEEGVLPHSRSRGSPAELEEERRLCFVGITRAQERLILSRAAYRMIRGVRERTVMSPFLNEIPAEAIDLTDRTGLDYDQGGRIERKLAEIEAEERAGQFRKGQLVRHPTFGLGRIFDIAHTGLRTVAQVDFNAVGRKTLVLEAARLEAVQR